jgi:hypothetical protein
MREGEEPTFSTPLQTGSRQKIWGQLKSEVYLPQQMTQSAVGGAEMGTPARSEEAWGHTYIGGVGVPVGTWSSLLGYVPPTLRA